MVSMAPERCARCGELTELPEDYDVCETCIKKVGTGDVSRMLAPEAYEDMQEDMPDHIQERREERERKRKERAEKWDARHKEAQQSGEVFEGGKYDVA